MDVDGRAQELVDDTGAGEYLEHGGFDRRSPGLMMRFRRPIHDPGADAVAGKLAASKEPGRPAADNENVLPNASFPAPRPGWRTKLIQLKVLDSSQAPLNLRTRDAANGSCREVGGKREDWRKLLIGNLENGGFEAAHIVRDKPQSLLPQLILEQVRRRAPHHGA